MTKLSTVAAAALIATTGLVASVSAASAADFRYRGEPQVQLYVQGPDFYRFEFWRRHHHPRPMFERRFDAHPSFDHFRPNYLNGGYHY